MKARQNSEGPAEGLVLKGKFGDVTQLEVIYEKEELSFERSLATTKPPCWIKSSTTSEGKN